MNSLLRQRDPPVFCSRTLRIATLLGEGGHQKLVDLTAQNSKDLCEIMQWNADNNIKLFRLSSEVRPRRGFAPMSFTSAR